MFRISLTLSLALALTGCLDVCTRAENLSTQFHERHVACFPSGTLPNAPFDATKCDDSMKVCTDRDEVALQTYFDCLDRMPVCTPSTKAAFTESFLKCASGMNQLSSGCFVPGG